MCQLRYLVSSFLLLLLMENSKAAPGTRSVSLEEASLQFGTLQAQAQYPPAAVQGARAASRSAASCLVTAVQYTHGQQIWRADPCEFCLCLDGEMFCWWQDCPPAAPGPCPGPQPFSLCGNSSGLLEKKPTPASKKIKKVTKKVSDPVTKKTKKLVGKVNSNKPLITVSQNSTASSLPIKYDRTTNMTFKLSNNDYYLMGNKTDNLAKNNEKEITKKEMPFYSSFDINNNYTESVVIKQENVEGSSAKDMDSSGIYDERTWLIEDVDESLKYKYDSKNTEISTGASSTGCTIMGKFYQIGEMLPSTGSCLTCHCTRGNGDSSPARVSCAPRGCAPPDPAQQDDTGAF